MTLLENEKIVGECPVDLRALSPVPASTEADVKRALNRARTAQLAWSDATFADRVAPLKKAARAMLERRQEVLELLHDEIGKTPTEGLMSEAIGPLSYLSDWVSIARPYLKPQKLPINRLAFPGKSGVVETLPRGVIGVIAPWNFPLGYFFKPIFPALLCGNAVLIKPSEHAPRTADWFARILAQYLPPGLVQCVHGDGEVGRLLIRSGIDALTFTGSTGTGIDVLRQAAEQLIPCSVELGGKDAALVLADCALDRTVAGILYWGLHNVGQACAAIERVYVEHSIANAFVERLGRAVARLRVHSGAANQSDLGPISNRGQLSVVQHHIADAIERGATLVCGGKATGKGLWFEPTVLDRCDHTMKVMTEPTFGPVIAICRVANPEEGISRMNDCAYGLNASIWSSDRKRAQQLARRVEAGAVLVNNHAVTGAMAYAPWTGVKRSGYGVANSALALSHFTRPRTIVTDRNAKPDPWWFPMNETLEALGHHLADVQLGKISSAWKIPFELNRRSREVINFVNKDGPPVTRLRPRWSKLQREARSVLQSLGETADLNKTLDRLNKILAPRLTKREREWGRLAMEAIFPSQVESRLPGPLTAGEAEAHFEDINANSPLLTGIGLRAALWTAGLSPLLVQGKWTTLDKLTPQEQIDAMHQLYNSDKYVWRQVSILLKATSSLAYARTSRFRSAPVFSPVPSAPTAPTQRHV